MARPKAIRAPTAASLPNTLRIPSSTPSLIKSFSRLSRQALLDLVFQWLDDRNAQLFPPYLEQDEAENPDDDELSPYPAAETIEDVRNAYQDLEDRKGGKREVIDRILEGDWRHGITLRQLAMVDIRYMEDHPASLRWTAFELSHIGIDGARSAGATVPDISACLPRIHAATFLSNLQQQISPLVKAHYHLVRSSSLPLSFLRILVTNSPYQNPRQPPEALMDSSRVMYVAFPDSCPFIYTSIATSPVAKSNTSTNHAVATDARSLQRIVRDALPKALSRPQERYALKATSLTAKNLQALLALRGPGRSNAANGAFSIFADAVLEGSPLDPRPSDTISPEEHFHQDSDPGKENENQEDSGTSKETEPTSHIAKKRKLAVHSRFGTSGTLSSAPLDRLDVRLLDPANDEDDQHDVDRTQPTVSLTFAGSDVISGIRKLAELGVVEPERMPSWMTGEEAVSVAVVRRGKRIIKDG
ncbi:hypothetical protein IFM58399_00991 [Aspergillus lentulus]|uniref:Kinetochore protein mis15 n=1 Tax=Aspergillus lentulus TaxID=293939 RepID=A0AAN5YXR0_ASPLE|nr:uncharacterized protein IFM58399_00991 [Aspergillus lentulus]KAF4168656.1 hypothetical protein CNMCM6936_001531 [Aspergillus lentulus]KAF4172391.1 hypothetical protein CNMCM8060_001502 [Aspergillus lentulus]KAF4188231.1 hypothetical protein CNMCM7927_002328 [Aspergillus lentulus]KAF4195431.1 hypothetical protein CNMCM8694_006357 [Aspergillus lentulus]KAF4207691.1 hypothetical protein CNMCM8927_002388 [Aspergillus lentulus]